MKLAGFVLLAPLLAAAATVGAADLPDPAGAYCGDDYWFTLDAPADWQHRWLPGGEGVALVFLPPQDGERPPPVAISLTLVLNGRSARDVRVDVDDAVHRIAGLLGVLGKPNRMTPLRVDHPTFPTAGLALQLDAGQILLVAVDPHSGNGNYFVARLEKTGSPLGESEVATFRSLIRSIRYDATLACEPGKAGKVVAVRRRGREPASAPAAPSP